MTDTEALEMLKTWAMRCGELHDTIGAQRKALSDVGLKFENEDGDKSDPFARYERFWPVIKFTRKGWNVRLCDPVYGARLGDGQYEVLQPIAPTVPEAVEIARPAVLSLFGEMEDKVSHFKRVVAVASERIAGAAP